MSEPGDVQARFGSPGDARRAVAELELAGFSHDQVELDEGRPALLESLVPEDEREHRPATVTVHTDGRLLEAASILHRYGGADATESPHVEHRSPGRSLELREEELRPRVSVVPIGEVRVSKVVVSETRTLEVEVRHEEIQVERLPPGPDARAPADAELGAGEEVYRIPLYAEEIEVVKRPVVREEVVIRKRRVPETRRVSAELKRERPAVKADPKVRLRDLTGSRKPR